MTPHPRLINTTVPALAVMLALLAMLGPFSVDTYLPAFPDMEASLGATTLEVQQTLTLYMVCFGAMMLWHGALSDSFGRRNVILISLAVFVVATLGCAASHTIQYLWSFRALQGLSAGAGIVVGRAMIRDLFDGPEAERLLSLVTMLFAVGPAIAPVIGGWIVTLLDWRSIFLFIFFYSALLLIFCWKRLPETLPPEKRHAFNARFLWDNYSKVFSTARFHFLAGALAFNFAGMFLYVASAPTFIIRHLGLGPQQFAWLFVPLVSGVFLGALLANRSTGRLRQSTRLAWGYLFLFGAALGNLIYHLNFPPAVPWSIMPIFFYALGMSMVAPSLTLQVLDLFPNTRGLAASCQAATQTLLGGLIAGVLAPLLSPSVTWLAAGQLVLVTTGLISWRLGQRMKAAALRSGGSGT